ncbi:MAG: hypothetical protein KGH72_01020 [Candidatus Micrarchaeota archaeon]|nr:hypothetical protein [Candidatus Micrarchaeota archaeon]
MNAERKVAHNGNGRHGWLEAMNTLRGGLPSNILLDEVLMQSEAWMPIMAQGYHGSWTREVLVHPAANGTFIRGKAVVDAFRDGAGRRWVFPASQIPEEAIGVRNVALVVNPHIVDVQRGRVTIIALPGAVTVLAPFMQQSGFGAVEPSTRLPLASNGNGFAEEGQKGHLYRIEGAGVRPMARYFILVDRGLIYASIGPDENLGGVKGGNHALGPGRTELENALGGAALLRK